MRLCIVMITMVGLHLQCCDSKIRKRSVEIQAVDVEEIQIDDSQLNANEIPLLAEPLNPVGNPASLVDNPDGTVGNPGGGVVGNQDSETMETANNLVFRPLFSYRRQNVERRSVTTRRQNRRGEATSGGAYGNYFSNPPPYLVYNRQTGAYHPYYFYPNYNKVRRG